MPWFKSRSKNSETHVVHLRGADKVSVTQEVDVSSVLALEFTMYTTSHQTTVSGRALGYWIAPKRRRPAHEFEKALSDLLVQAFD